MGYAVWGLRASKKAPSCLRCTGAARDQGLGLQKGFRGLGCTRGLRFGVSGVRLWAEDWAFGYCACGLRLSMKEPKS